MTANRKKLTVRCKHGDGKAPAILAAITTVSFADVDDLEIDMANSLECKDVPPSPETHAMWSLALRFVGRQGNHQIALSCLGVASPTQLG